MGVEPDDDIQITMEEVNAYFDRLCQIRGPDGKPLKQRPIADLLDVSQSTISRSKGNRTAGKDVSPDVYKKIAHKILRRNGERNCGRSAWRIRPRRTGSQRLRAMPLRRMNRSASTTRGRRMRRRNGCKRRRTKPSVTGELEF